MCDCVLPVCACVLSLSFVRVHVSIRPVHRVCAVRFVKTQLPTDAVSPVLDKTNGGGGGVEVPGDISLVNVTMASADGGLYPVLTYAGLPELHFVLRAAG
jgi:hypothetical protein